MPPASLDLQAADTSRMLHPPPLLHLQLLPDLGSCHRFPCFASKLEVERAVHHLPRSHHLRVSSPASNIRSLSSLRSSLRTLLACLWKCFSVSLMELVPTAIFLLFPLLPSSGTPTGSPTFYSSFFPRFLWRISGLFGGLLDGMRDQGWGSVLLWCLSSICRFCEGLACWWLVYVGGSTCRFIVLVTWLSDHR
jgi:hypothetical protein